MNVLRFMIPKSLVEYVTEDNTVRQALEKMRYHRYAAIPVLDGEGKYIGTLRNDDILHLLWGKPVAKSLDHLSCLGSPYGRKPVSLPIAYSTLPYE